MEFDSDSEDVCTRKKTCFSRDLNIPLKVEYDETTGCIASDGTQFKPFTNFDNSYYLAQTRICQEIEKEIAELTEKANLLRMRLKATKQTLQFR